MLLCSLQEGHAREMGASSSHASLISEVSRIAQGNTFRIAVKISVDKGSHIYWKNPGEIGSPLRIQWILPEGFSVEKEHWPTPKVFEEENITFFGYDDSAFIIADLRAPEAIHSNEVTIGAHVEWLACGEHCIPGDEHLEISLPCGNSSISSSERSQEFAQALHLTPHPLEDNQLIAFTHGEEGEIILSLAHHNENAEKAWFISETANQIVAYAESSTKEAQGTAWNLKIKNLTNIKKDDHLEGVLLLTDKAGKKVESFAIRGQLTSSPDLSTSLSGFMMTLAMAFLGGLLLNIMPCVLPLVTLKVYGLIKSSGENRTSALSNGLWFTSGVVGCFWILAGVGFLLKTLGHNIGWGFQLQEPAFVSVLVIIFFLFALSSLGLFEIGTTFSNLGGRIQAHRCQNKYVSSFFNGVLATLVTTPCTGPFLGSVLGLVMSLSFSKQITVFTAIGLGMALPYLLFAIFPKLLVILPKPGSWMNTFKQVMGFMLLATVTWLLWVFGSETSMSALVLLISGLWLAGFGGWVLGKWGTPISSKRLRLTAYAVFVMCLGGAIMSGIFGANQFKNDPQYLENYNSEDWQPFSYEKLDQLRKEGKAVFVNFTAKWCLTCQMNKPILHSKIVREKFKSRNIVMLEADWTRKDPGITEELARLGRASVPTYVYYPENQSKPVILPERISQALLEEVVFSK
nr:thioredoxin family protein [Chlamydia ibidis]